MKVAYVTPFVDRDYSNLKEKLDDDIELDILSSSDEEGLVERAAEYDTVIGARISEGFFEKAENLDHYIIPFAGIPEDDRELLSRFPDITVINSHFNSWMVAEFAFTLLLSSAKKLIPIHERLKEGDWTPRYEHQWGLGLKDKTLLILGYGRIGEKIAKRADAFDMKVKAVKRTPGDDPKLDFLGTNDDMPELLLEADFVVTTLPETEKTKGFLGKEEFDVMKDDVHVVNVGRGPVIDEEALYEALKDDKIGGAAIDTWWNYPPDEGSRSDTFPSNYPLDEFDNVIFSPHRSSHIRDREKYRMENLAGILNELSQEELVNEVDIEEGY